MRSPHSAIPTIAIKAEAGGWVATCSTCGAESFQTRRPQADRWAYDHLKTHGGKAG